MILLVGHYEEAQPQRAAEYREALRRNVANEHIECIRLLIEDGTSAELLRARGEPYDNAKVQIASQGKRLTFDALFSMAERDWSGYPVIMANADIAFDDTLAMLEDVALQGSLLCLSRWNESADGRLDHFDAPNSQDAWIFEPPLPAIACAFELGTPGCDNRLAHEASRAGLRVLNPSRSLRSAHLHNSQVRNYTQRQRLQARTALCRRRSWATTTRPTPAHRSITVRIGHDKSPTERAEALAAWRPCCASGWVRRYRRPCARHCVMRWHTP